MPYLTRAQVDAGPVPTPFIVQALDDDRDGQEDEGKFDAILSNIATQIDAILSSRYTVPFTDPAPSLVTAAAYNWVNYELYRRRGLKDAENPCFRAHEITLGALQKVAKGEGQLHGLDTVAPAAAGSQTVVSGRLVNRSSSASYTNHTVT